MPTEFNIHAEFSGWENRSSDRYQAGNYVFLGVGGATVTARVKVPEKDLDQIPEGCMVEVTGIVTKREGRRVLSVHSIRQTQATRIQIVIKDKGVCEFFDDKEGFRRASFVCPSDTFNLPKNANVSGLEEGADYVVSLGLDTFTRVTESGRRFDEISLMVRDVKKIERKVKAPAEQQ